MSKVGIDKFKMCCKDEWTDEFKKEVGESVLERLHSEWAKQGTTVGNCHAKIVVEVW